MDLKKPIRINHKCSCGVIHLWFPVTAREWVEDGDVIGYFWECECKSTLFISVQKLRRLSEEV